MDPSRFDGLARGVAGFTSRRTTLAGLLAALAVPLLGEAESKARKKRNQNGRDHGHDQDAGKKQVHSGHGVDAEKKKKKKKCKPPTTKCGKKCFNLQTDGANCGACGNVCPSGVACVSGACLAPATCGAGPACSSDQTCCAGACVDTKTDVNNCDGCGTVCDPLKTDSCAGGVCKCGASAACGANEQCCGGQCANLTTVQNCGACGNVCPGYQTPNTNVTCSNGSTCIFSCQGDHWDVDGNPANGCEGEYTFGNHTQGTSTPLGTVSCSDSSGGTTPVRTFYSDARAHETPAIAGFDAATGSAPHWWSINATGGFGCVNDLDVKLTMTGATGNCYKLSVITDKGTYTAQTANGVAQVTRGSSSYTDGTVVYFRVEKTCGTTVREAPTYTITAHL